MSRKGAIDEGRVGFPVHSLMLSLSPNCHLSFFHTSRQFSIPNSLSTTTTMGFEQQVKERAHELKNLFKKSVKVVGNYSKKGWYKVKNLRK